MRTLGKGGVVVVVVGGGSNSAGDGTQALVVVGKFYISPSSELFFL